jgi:hypothetical protein
MLKLIGVLMQIAGVVIVIFLAIAPLASSPIEASLTPLFCAPGETLSMSSTTTFGNHQSVYAHCVNSDGEKRDVTWNYVLLIVVVGVLPIFIGNWLRRMGVPTAPVSYGAAPQNYYPTNAPTGAVYPQQNVRIVNDMNNVMSSFSNFQADPNHPLVAFQNEMFINTGGVPLTPERAAAALQKLSQLRDMGIITPQQFEALQQTIQQHINHT